MAKKSKAPKQVTNLTHDATRLNIPAAEAQPLVDDATKRPIRVEIERRNPDLDPQLVWRGKSDGPLVVNAPPLYVQEKIHPKHLIDDLVAETKARQKGEERDQLDLFGDFNGVPEGDAKTEFYQHEAHWTNRMILGDSLQVMTSLAERENLRGKVQCIYFDPPYGIKFNSNFQWSTKSRDVKDGSSNHITRDPQQVKAFRDTWNNGIHSYLDYLRSRLVSSRELLKETGSIFIQIGNKNVHIVRLLMDEIMGSDNFISQIQFQKTGSQSSNFLGNTVDYILWYAKSVQNTKFRRPYLRREPGDTSSDRYNQLEELTGKERRLSKAEVLRHVPIPSGKVFRHTSLISDGNSGSAQSVPFQNRIFNSKKGSHWKTSVKGMQRLDKAGRISSGLTTLRYKRYLDDFAVLPIGDHWESLQIGKELNYVVQTASKVIERCILMTTDPSDLVLDPTCGSGTAAFVAEKHGRRWIVIDTSRVALALSRTRIMAARFPYYLLADSKEGQKKLAELKRVIPSNSPTSSNLRQGFVYERVPHITLKDIANNAEIDVIHENFQEKLEPLRKLLNELVGRKGARKSPAEAGDNGPWEEWEIPRTIEELAVRQQIATPAPTSRLAITLAEWWKLRIARQEEIDASIAAKADVEYLYDKPYEDKSKVRVAGPFTVESISPHRMLGVDENDEVFDQLREEDAVTFGESHDFGQLILENLRVSGVQQSAKEDRITFDSLVAFPGRYINAEGKYTEDDGTEVRAGIHIGPEYGSITRPDLVEAAREAADNSFDVLIACGFNYEAHTTEFSKLGRIPVLKARMNADLHMAQDLKATGAGNLFVIFGEPDIKLAETEDGKFTVEVLGVDIFDPKTGKVRSDNVDGIACWFVDANYSGESFFVRHAYFLGAESSYNSLKRSLKAEVDEEAWESLHSAVSRPFDKPSTGRIAVKIINHLGDEVMKVVGV